MKNLIISLIIGLFGILPFLFGAASSGGGYFVVLAFPAKLLQYAVLNWGFSLDDVQLNRWAIVAQFIGYFLLTLIVISIRNIMAAINNQKEK